MKLKEPAEIPEPPPKRVNTENPEILPEQNIVHAEADKKRRQRRKKYFETCSTLMKVENAVIFQTFLLNGVADEDSRDNLVFQLMTEIPKCKLKCPKVSF